MATSEITGCAEQPLLSAEQIVPGVFITGLGFNNVWEVLRTEGQQVHMVKVTCPQSVPCTGEHELRRVTTGQECRCGYRIHSMTGLLPTRPDTARAVVLAPTGSLVIPDKYTVYTTVQGQIVNAEGNRWARDMPIFPQVCAIWSVPEELRALLEP